MPFYTPGATEDELKRMFAVAAEVPGAAGYVHLRYAGLGANGQPGAVQALEEVLKLSREAKAPLHVSHITSSGLAATPALLKMVADAKAQGQDVTTELYPYTAAMSGINSTWFAPGWQQTLAISYDKLQWPKTGEVLTEATFKKYQRENPGDEVIIHAIPQDAFVAALKDPNTMIISDGLVFPNLVAHPRSSGTSARVLGPLVREQRLLPLMDALRKMTLMPAQRLEVVAPAMKNKGRVRVGADADLAISIRRRSPTARNSAIPRSISGVPIRPRGRRASRIERPTTSRRLAGTCGSRTNQELTSPFSVLSAYCGRDAPLRAFRLNHASICAGVSNTSTATNSFSNFAYINPSRNSAGRARIAMPTGPRSRPPPIALTRSAIRWRSASVDASVSVRRS